MTKKLLAFLLLVAPAAYGVETLTINSSTRNVINLGAVNFATGQLKVNGIAVNGGAGGGGGGGGTIDNVRLNAPSVMFDTPVDFTISGGLAEGTLSLSSQAAGTFLSNLTGVTATPIFNTTSAVKIALGVDLMDNTADLDKPISDLTQDALDVLTSDVATNASGLSSLTTTVAGKADTTTVNSALALKAAITYVDSSIAAFTGTTNLVTLGTVTTGVWSGTALVAGKVPALNSITAPTGSVSLNSQKIISLADPTGATDAANKQYVDSVAATGPPHPFVVTASTNNRTLSGEQTIDGVLTSASRVLLKNQTSSEENGIYVTAAGAWARASDANADAEISGSVFVTGGTVNAGTTWALVTPQPITLNTDPLSYTQTGANTVYTATGGITLSGSQFSLSNLSGAGKLMGRYTTGAGSPQEITVSTGLSIDSSGNLTGSGLTSFTTGNLSPLFTATLGSTPTTTPALAFTLSNAAANTFYGNGTSLSAAPTFMSASTARTAMGGTSVGQGIFTITDPSAIGYARINANNSVSFRTPSETRTDIGAGTVASVSTTNNVPSLFAASVLTTTTTPTMVFDPVASAANTFYGNGTGASANPTFMSASTARGALGGTTVGQNLFTLANPSAITYPRISATNTVTAATAATVLSDIGGVSTTDTRLGATVTGIRKSSGAPSTDVAATVNVDYAQDSEGTFTDTGTTGTPTAWTAGKTVMRESAALATVTRYSTLPSASSYAPGTVLLYIDDKTIVPTLGRVFRGTGGNTINGSSADVLPFIAGGLGGNVTSQRFATDGISNWRMLDTGYRAAAFIDPVNKAKNVTVDVSAQTASAGYKFLPALAGDGWSVKALSATSGQFVTGLAGDNVNGGTLTTSAVTATDIIPNEFTVGNTDTPITNSGSIDTVKLNEGLSAARRYTFPDAGNYSSGEIVRFYDSTGTVTKDNYARIVTSDSYATANTFNGNTAIDFTEPYFNRIFVADPTNHNWTVSTFGSTSGNQFTIDPWHAVTPSSGVVTINSSSSVEENHHTVSMSGDIVLAMTGAADGTHGIIEFVDSSGGHTVTVPNATGKTPTTSGTGTFLTSTGTSVHDVYRWDCIGGTSYSFYPLGLKMIAAAAATYSTPADNSTGLSHSAYVNYGNVSGREYIAVKLVASDTGTYTAGKWRFRALKQGTPTFNLRCYILNDNGAGAPNVSSPQGTISSAVASSTLTGSEGNLDFDNVATLVNGTTYWVILKAESPPNNSADYVQISIHTTSGYPIYRSATGLSFPNVINNNQQPRMETFK